MRLPITQTHPQVSAEWHPSKNGDLRVSSAMPGSDRFVWWLGSECGHEWDARINVRTKQGQGCPICAGKRVLTGFNDLATIAPEIASEWHPTKNGSIDIKLVKAGSSDRAWWLGKLCGHEWEAVIRQRVQSSSGCPVCVGRLIITGINDLATTHADLSSFWDYRKNKDITPQNIIAGSKVKYHWRCPKNHEFFRAVSEQSIKISGYCPECSPKNIIPGLNDLATLYPVLATEWHPTLNGALLPTTVSPESHEIVWWVGSTCQHNFEASVRNRAKKNSKCTICSNQKVLLGQ